MPPVYITDLRGGRNGIDSPVLPGFPMTQCVEALNVDFREGPLGRKINGSVDVAVTGGTGFTTSVRFLGRHVPAGDETAAELWGIDSAGTPLMKRLAGGVAWANVAVGDAIAGSQPYIEGVSFNGKYFIFYDSAVDRSHLWDGTTFRRVGLAAPSAAPTVANQGVGAYPAVARYYRTRAIEVSGSLLIRRSEYSATSAVFTPSGAGASARITNAGMPGEGETHWEVEFSYNNSAWYLLAGFELGTQILIATATYDDSSTSTSNSYIAPATGQYSTFTSMRFGITDGNRLIMAGSYEGGKSSRVYVTPVLGSLNKGDDERLDYANTTPYLDLNEKDGGQITALGGPINQAVWTFKYRQISRLTPTGDVDVPYQARKYSSVVGAVNNKCVVTAEDLVGNPAIYFWSYKGPYRIGINGLEYLGRDVEDYIKGLNGKSAINLAATIIPVFACYYSDLNQVWFWVSTGANNYPDTILKLDVKQARLTDRFGIRGGWMVQDGAAAAAYCATMFANTLGASMSTDLKPYVGRVGASFIQKCDTGTTFNTVAFQAYIKTRSIMPVEKLGERVGVEESILTAKAAAGVTIRQTVDRDFGLESITDDVLLTAEAAETRVIRKFSGSMGSDAGIIQIQLGDAAAVDSAWSLDALMIPVVDQGDL